MKDGYARRNAQVEGKKTTVLMHREILGLVPGDGLQVDHINGNRLDNCRENLRICTHAQNHQNYHTRLYRGVAWCAARNRWQAQAKLDGKNHWLGYFATEEEAAAVAAAWRRQHMPYSSDAREALEGAPVD
jgi:hypothetical protein